MSSWESSPRRHSGEWHERETECRPTATKSEVVLAHRYLYYVKGTPVITDQEYDKLEAALPDGDPVKNGVGSDRECDYTPKVKRLAKGLLEAHNE